jgi:hypothetical protein
MSRLIAVANTLLNYAEKVKDGVCYMDANTLINIASTIIEIANKEVDPYSCPVHMKLLTGCVTTHEICCKCPLGRQYTAEDAENIKKASATVP